ncbi:hypothetical protein [Streptomyces californicus]
MSYPDPFDERSPWDEAPDPPTPKEKEPPLTSADNDSPPFEIGFTLKAGSGFDAEWITPRVHGSDATEAAQRGAALLTALKAEGLIDLTSKAAEYTRSQHKGGGGSPKRFAGGRVESAETAPTSVTGDTCPHGRSLVKKPNWTAMFCDGPDGDKCEPLWQDKKTGQFKANK